MISPLPAELGGLPAELGGRCPVPAELGSADGLAELYGRHRPEQEQEQERELFPSLTFRRPYSSSGGRLPLDVCQTARMRT